MDNQIVTKYFEHHDFSPYIKECLEQACATTGFSPTAEIHRRFIYDPDKVWRVCIVGNYQGKSAVLRLENLKLEIDDEEIRKQFRMQCGGHHVRPPHTYFAQSFDEKTGFALYIEELIEGQSLFKADKDPETASQSFSKFYRLLRETIKHPFWDKPNQKEMEFSSQQMQKWYDLAFKKYPERTTRLASITDKLRGRIIANTNDAPLRFQHAHLSATDVKINSEGEYIVFANHFWSWRQNGYDISFPIWNMWLHLPSQNRTPEAVKHITQTWLDMINDSLRDLLIPLDVELMILNRLYGSLLLDLPAKLNFEAKQAVDDLETALIAESERLLG